MSEPTGPASEAPKEKKPNENCASYDKMPPAMRWQWQERMFNLHKLRGPLLSADAVLTYAFILWAGLAMLMAILAVVDAARFPLRLDFAYALAAFLVYYSVIGFIRRQTERNHVFFCSQHPDVEGCMAGKAFEGRKPYDDRYDPPLARGAFRLRTALGLPRRGLAQGTVVVWQFVIGMAYAWSYGWYIVYKGDVSFEHYPDILWFYHVTVTGGGLLILLKNAGFLIDTNKLLKTIEALVGGVMGHSHQSITVENRNGTNQSSPCGEETKNK